MVDGKVGMRVRRGFLLKLAKRATATIVCADRKIHKLLPGWNDCPCTAAIRTPDARNPPRGSDTAHSTYPIVISTRGTDLLTTRPTIRWSAPARSSVETSYNVSIERDGQPVWPRKTVKGTELVYPANEPELTPGLYLVVVSTSTGSSDEEQVTDRGFVVLPQCREPNFSRATPCKRNKIREEVQRLRAPNFPAEATSLLIADLYAENRLYAEAIQELETTSQTVRLSSILCMLGDLYLTVRLNREAERYYLEVLKLPEMVTDLKTRASTLKSLALTSEQLVSRSLALTRYDEAISAYITLGYVNEVVELKRRRKKLESNAP